MQRLVARPVGVLHDMMGDDDKAIIIRDISSV